MTTTQFTNAYQPFIPEVWSKRLQELLHTDCVMLQCVNRNYEGEIKAAGDTVNILTPGDVSVSTLHGDALSYNEITPSTQALTISQKKFFAFKLNDVATAQAGMDLMEAHLTNAKKAIEVDQDSYLLSLHLDADDDNITNTAATATAITATNVYAKFVELAKVLKNANALKNAAQPWVVINPDIEAILLQCSQFTSSYQMGEKTVREGAIGRIAGLDVLVSTNLKAASGGAIPVLAGTNAAITFASQVSKIEKIRDINSFSDLVRGLYLYGAKVVEPKALALSYMSLD